MSRSCLFLLCLMSFMCAHIAEGAQDAVQFNLEDQKAYMDAQIELLKKQTDLSAALKNWAQVGAESLPSVVSIGVRGREAYTRILLSNGSVMLLRDGDSIKRGLTVSQIEPQGVWVDVELSKGVKKRLRLEFAQLAARDDWMPSDVLAAIARPIGFPVNLEMASLPRSALVVPPRVLSKTTANPVPSATARPNPNATDLIGPAHVAPDPNPEPPWMSRRTR